MNEERNSSDYKIENLDSDQLRKLIWELREEILDRIKKLSKQWEKIHEIQKRRDRAEERLAELGGHIGRTSSKTGGWKEGEVVEKEEEEEDE